MWVTVTKGSGSALIWVQCDTADAPSSQWLNSLAASHIDFGVGGFTVVVAMEMSEGVHKDQQGSDNSWRWSGEGTDQTSKYWIRHEFWAEDAENKSCFDHWTKTKITVILGINCMEVSVHCNRESMHGGLLS